MEGLRNIESYNLNMINKRVYRISEFIDLRKHIAIYGEVNTGKRTLLKKIATEIYENNKNIQIFIVPEVKGKFKNFINNTKANIKEFTDMKDIKYLSKILDDEMDYKDNKITIIIDNLYNILDKDEEAYTLIRNIIAKGRRKGINLIMTIIANEGINPFDEFSVIYPTTELDCRLSLILNSVRTNLILNKKGNIEIA